MNTVCIYDNHIFPSVFISNIVGNKKFSEIIIRRESVEKKFADFVKKINEIENIIFFNNEGQLEEIKNYIRSLPGKTRIVHVFSNEIIADKEKAKIFFQKAGYVNENYVWLDNKGSVTSFMMADGFEYCDFIDKNHDKLSDGESYRAFESFREVKTDVFCDISEYSNFLRYISGGFDSRFFNSINNNGYTLVKASKNKKKIKMEYSLYNFLPEDMKPWFVMPYGYTENDETASYTMKSYRIPDMAIRWVHDAVGIDEFDNFLRIIFTFVNNRHSRSISEGDYERMQHEAYVAKVEERIKELESHPLYPELKHLLPCDDYISKLYERYMHMYNNNKEQCSRISVVGHGDLCFSNILFDKNTELLKLIDPRGALSEQELWMDPYYDIAKLSHSICGYYDYFNNGLYRIEVDSDLKLHLEIEADNAVYIERFKNYVQENGYSYKLVRIYESSLFLSMLPLHMDNPHKVLGFILNADRILSSIEEMEL